ncbi:hypothetical protein EDEG_00561 [Edhazardia aedis USNM 41457]|uniref:Uncharacterized protein n=1 Tax=Edhazardia aedis (strain USNM 41457) TaxID=1003232 RepID=J8ZNH1_EDHAE|nr:hypothetical protein EDEG_00561 [Edhazardia aedis USNM 41457]|eukprot:EJW01228.1 hypothetical protein EDEG_00561 [Edhazardia aedis USNM 41457]
MTVNSQLTNACLNKELQCKQNNFKQDDSFSMIFQSKKKGKNPVEDKSKQKKSTGNIWCDSNITEKCSMHTNKEFGFENNNLIQIHDEIDNNSHVKCLSVANLKEKLRNESDPTINSEKFEDISQKHDKNESITNSNEPLQDIICSEKNYNDKNLTEDCYLSNIEIYNKNPTFLGYHELEINPLIHNKELNINQLKSYFENKRRFNKIKSLKDLNTYKKKSKDIKNFVNNIQQIQPGMLNSPQTEISKDEIFQQYDLNNTSQRIRLNSVDENQNPQKFKYDIGNFNSYSKKENFIDNGKEYENTIKKHISENTQTTSSIPSLELFIQMCHISFKYFGPSEDFFCCNYC